MAGQKKADREWAGINDHVLPVIAALPPSQRTDSALGVLATCFNTTPERLRSLASGLTAAAVAAKRAEAERLQKELAEHDAASKTVATAAEAKAAEVDKRLNSKAS